MEMKMARNEDPLGLLHFLCGGVGLLIGVLSTLAALNPWNSNQQANKNIAQMTEEAARIEAEVDRISEEANRIEEKIQANTEKLETNNTEFMARRALQDVATSGETDDVCETPGGFWKIRDPLRDSSAYSICTVPLNMAFVFYTANGKIEFVPTTR